ncbi:MAG: recombinase family protein [Actinomycetia bacterium]|nr:recombinase family protein [Actinomycetes bacterium]
MVRALAPDAPPRAALYVRVSTEEQATEGLSLDAQLRALRAYCAAHGWVEAAAFVDAGESARTDKRPEFQRMIAVAQRKPRPFDVILVHKTDRFARNREDSAVYKSLLRKQCGIEVVSATEQFDDTPAGKLTEGILETIAEFYSANLSQEVRKGMIEAARRGRALGLPPLGYRIGEDGRLAVVEEDAAVVRWIFAEYASGRVGMNTLARHLRQAPLSPRAQRYRWSAQAIRGILTNRTYLGEFRWRSRDGKHDPIVVPNAHPAIVDEATFRAVQTRLGRERPPRTRWGDYALRGLGRCAACGASLSFYREQSRPNRRTGARRTRDLLVCSAYYRYRCTGGYRNWILLAQCEEAIWTTLRQVVAGHVTVDPDRVEWSERDTWQRRLAAVRRQLEAIAARQERLLVAYETGVLDLSEFQAAKRRLADARAALEGEAAALERQLVAPTVPISTLKDRIEQVLAAGWETMAPTERRELLEAVVSHFTWSRRTGTLVVTFKV